MKNPFIAKPIKKWFHLAEVKAQNGYYEITLDGQVLHAPQQHNNAQTLKILNLNLAQAICAEWNGLTDKIDLAFLPLTQFILAVQNPEFMQRTAIIKAILSFAAGDICRFQDPSTPALFAKQEALCTPLLHQLKQDHDIEISIIYDLNLVPLAEKTQIKLKKILNNMDDLCLMCFYRLCEESHSFVLAMGLFNHILSLETAMEICFLEEDIQQAAWGIDPDSAKRKENMKQALYHAQYCIKLAQT